MTVTAPSRVRAAVGWEPVRARDQPQMTARGMAGFLGPAGQPVLDAIQAVEHQAQDGQQQHSDGDHHTAPSADGDADADAHDMARVPVRTRPIAQPCEGPVRATPKR